MKILTKHWPMLVVTCSGAAALIASLCVLRADEPQPVLTIAPTGTNQLLISITNSYGTNTYELYRTPILNEEVYPWTLNAIGTAGQSNFVVNIGPENTGFWRAAIGTDWDGDGIPNAIDANPNDSGIGILTVTILSPTNGMKLQ